MKDLKLDKLMLIPSINSYKTIVLTCLQINLT